MRTSVFQSPSFYFVLLVLLCSPTSSHAFDGEPFKVGIVRDMFLAYASFDALVYNGTAWWAQWVNDQGGLVYNGSSHQVQVISVDASTPDPNQTTTRVNQGYESLVNDYKVNMLVSPYTTGRCQVAMNVAKKYKMINFVIAALTDSLFRSNDTWSFNEWIPSQKIATTSLAPLVAKGAKTFVVLRRPDTISMLTGAYGVEYLLSQGCTMLRDLWVNVTSTDTDQVSTLLRGGVTQLMEGIDEVDIFIYAGPSTEFPNIASVFAQLQINAKAAVHVLNNPRSVQKIYNLGQVGNYWIYPTRYDKEFNEGVSGVNGGTTLEFTKDFASRFGYEADFLDALTAAALIPYFYVVNQTHDISAFSVRENIRNMPKIPTFAGYKQYWQNGTNMWARIAPLQLIEGEGRFLTPGNIVYPAPFFPKSKSLDAKKIVAIAVPVGCVLIVAVAIGVFYMHKQRKQVVKALEQAEEGERRNYRIDYSALRMGNPIGAGGFGVVFKGEYRGADVAVKKLKAQKMSKPQLDEFAKESAIMIGLRHPNILLFMGVCIDPPELAIITEFMPYGSVYDIIHNENIALPFPLIKNMMLDVLKGLQFIHSAGIVHRDLKSPNLLVDKSWNIKIADFGLSAMKANTEEDVQISLLWTAPEILKKEANCYSDKSDVFSFAIIAWELMSRQLPYNNMEVVAITPAVVGGVRPPIDSAWDVQVSSLISSCWDGFAIRRPTVVEARSRVEMIFADPTFTIHSSMSLGKYSKDKMTAPSGGAVTFVFTAVFHPTQLWTHDPRSMARALLTHKEVLRDLMKSCKGVEVRSNTDACLFAFGDTIQALNFCLRAQTSLLHASWPETILAHPDAGEQRSSDAELLFRGLSLACGIHCTTATNSIDPDSGDIEYFSKEIGHASFFAGQAAKGWIAMGSDMYVKVMGNTDKLDPFAMDSMGTRLVGGKEITTYQMTAMSLKKRSTHATDVETLDDSPDEITSSSKIPFPGHGERWLINYEDLELREKIGAGSFGEVKLAIYKGKKVAVKQMLRQRMKDESALELQAESIILSSLSHPNVLSFLGVCTQLPNVCLVTEFMERGSLSDVLYGQQSQQLSWDQKIRMIQDIAQGLAFLHGKQIIHRDIKPQNMLVSHDYRVKIADLGFSRLKADNQTMTQVGTVAYSAPEIFGGQHYTEKADVYSFGIIVWEMIFGKKPWDRLHPMKVIPAVSTGQRLPLNNPPTGCPQSLLNLVQECWQHEPASRPAFAAIVNKI